MKLIAPLLFLHLSQAYKKLDECPIDSRSMKNVWENRLQEKILCNYNEDVPPQPFNGSEHIDVRASFIVQSFLFLSEEQEFKVNLWTFPYYLEERLRWDPKDYDGIEKFVKSGSKLWLPGIRLYNAISDLHAESYLYESHRNMPCRISSNGIVGCLSHSSIQAKCATDLNDWPYDTQICTLEFGPTSVPGNKIRLMADSQSVGFIGSEYGAEWNIMDVKQEEFEGAVRQLKLYFTLVRHAQGLAAIVIYPSVLLTVLTLSSLFLDVRCVNRVYLACYSLVCHFYFLSELGMVIPKHSRSSPKILFYYRGSVIMTTISFALTYLLKFLCKKKLPVPNFVAIVNENVYKTNGKFVIHPRWKAANNEDDPRQLAIAWIDFVSILNSAWIYVSLIVYVIMCIVLIPSPSGLKQKIYVSSYDLEFQ